MMSYGDNEMESLPIAEVLPQLIAELKLKASCGDSALIGTSTGLNDLDAMTSGLRPGSLCVLAARPAMGKFALALNLASHIAMNEGLPVIVFSTCLSAIQIAQRLAGIVGRIERHRLATGQLEDADWEKLSSLSERFSQHSLYINDTPGLDLHTIRAEAIKIADRHGKLGLIVIDSPECLLEMTTNEANAKVWKKGLSSLKKLAIERVAPVLLLSNLKKDAFENRKDPHPVMTDLPSYLIAQFADLLMFLYRDELYNRNTELKGIAEVILAKNVYGSIGTIRLRFDEYCCFYDL